MLNIFIFKLSLVPWNLAIVFSLANQRNTRVLLLLLPKLKIEEQLAWKHPWFLIKHCSAS
jgi:hypothetical protein